MREPDPSRNGRSSDIRWSVPGDNHGQLRLRLEQATSRGIKEDSVGCWLSGSLASHALAASARPHVEELHIFAVGTPGTPDLEYARQMASFLQREHHEITVTLGVHKWILRQALTGLLLDDLLDPPDTSLYRGAGVDFLLMLSAEDQISDEE